jgi:predicted dehydrogenase
VRPGADERVARVALVGVGRWGTNLLRTLAESAACELVAVADVSATARACAHTAAPRAAVCASLTEALTQRVDAIVIATPPATHAVLALETLAAGRSLLVEKPLATTVADATRCARAARAASGAGRTARSARTTRTGVVAMVGHLLRYHPTATQLTELALQGELGELRAVYAARLSTGGSPHEDATSLLLRLAPHDLSLLDALDPSPLVTATARTKPPGEGPALFAGHTKRGLAFHLALSRCHPEKVRRIAIVGTRRVALFDDVAAPREVLLADASALGGRNPLELKRFELTSRAVAWEEPLAAEVAHFLRCVAEGARPRTPFEEGLRVARSLARLAAAAKASGAASHYGAGAATAASAP